MSSRRLPAIVSSIASCVLAASVLMLSCDSAGPAVVRLRDHVPDAIKSARRVPADAGSSESQPVTLTIVLKRANESGFQEYLRDVYDPRSPRFHRFLTPSEITAQFGPSVPAYADVLSYLQNYGFRIVEGSANRMTITVSGRRPQAERAFGTRLFDYEANGRRFFSNDVEPSVPANLAPNIDAVVGLSNLPEPQPAQLAAALVNALSVLNWELRAVSVAAPELVGPTAAAIDATLAAADAAFWEVESIGVAEMLAGFEIVGLLARVDQNGLESHANSALSPQAALGAGQKIGILAFSSINPQDVADWLALTQRPASLGSQVTQVAVNGGAPLGPDETDVLMAVETILTVAPGAQIAIYHAPKATTSFQTLFNAMLNDGVTVISNSSTYCESQTSLADAQSINNILAAAAGAGINVFNATGDAGSSCSDGSANTIAVPADSPNAIAVGATSPTYGPDFTYGGEAWLDGSSRVPPTAQSGFGVSKFFNIPAYQTALISGTQRSVPDVVAPGDPKTGLAVCQADAGGCPTAQVLGGTSLATPFWAAVAALINQGTGHPIGFLNPLLYQLANTYAFHSATSMGTDAAHVGLGSPNGDPLALALSGHSAGTPSSTVSRIKATSSDPFLPFLGTVPSDGTSAAAIVVYLRDAKGNQVSGKTVKLTATSGNAVITPATGVSSSANGAVIFRVTDTTVENVTFTAADQSDGITLTQTAAVNFIGSPPSAGSISASPNTVPADGSSTTTITVTLQDAKGNGTPGKVVTLSQGSGHSIITAPNPAVTDANGQIAFTATDNVGETVTYTASDVTDGNLPVPGSTSVTYTGAGSSCVASPPTPAPGFTLTPFANGFAAQNFFYSNVNWSGCPGASNPAFDTAGHVIVSDFYNGKLYEFSLSGGVVSNADTLATIGQALEQPAFGKDGSLYIARGATGSGFNSGTILRVDPSTGAVLQTLVTGLTCPSPLAVDPLSGDLFFTDDCFGAGSDNPSLWRIQNPASANPTLVVYATLPSTPNGPIAFAPNGTMYVVNSYNGAGNIIQVGGTNTPSPPAMTTLSGINSDFWITMGEVQANGAAKSLLVHNNNALKLVDISTNPFTTTVLANGAIASGTIGPDGCLYAAASDTILKLAPTSGACGFTPSNPSPALTLSPGAVSPNPAQGTPVTFTASFNNLTVPANTSVVFNVLGPNIRSFLAHTGANGQASFTYSGVFAGTDILIASATVGGNTLTSNLANVIWTAGPHTSFCSLDLSAKTGNVGSTSNLTGVLFDVSVIPPVAVNGAGLALAVGGHSCSSATNAAGLAKCSVPLNSVGLFPLAGTFTGSSQLLGTTCASSFAVLSTNGPGTPPGAPTIGAVTAGNGQVSVSFTAPANNGGSSITSFTAMCTPVGGGAAVTAMGTRSPITVGGLLNGTTYTCAVSATNATGTGPASVASNVVTPAQVTAVSTPIPTLSQWALIVLAILLVLSTVVAVRRTQEKTQRLPGGRGSESAATHLPNTERD